MNGDFRGLENVLGVLTQSPRECLYCLINENERKVQVYSTSNFISHISRLVQEMNSLNNKELKQDLLKVKLVILETEFDNEEHRKRRFVSVCNKYKDSGYTFYRDTNIAQYSLKESYRYKKGQLYYVLELENPRGDRTLIGVFKRAKEANEFKKLHYSNPEIITEVVKSQNEETQLWL